MSEGVSAALRSNQPPLLKRSRAEDSDSERSTGRSSCRWAGCRRPGKLENDGGTHHPFCSPTHRDFFMADLYEMIEHGGAHVIEQPRGICKLPGCHLQVWKENSATGEAYDFCRRTHAVQYKEDMAEEWGSQGRLCKFGPCFNHVAVHETSKQIHEHCCIKHTFDAAGARGKQAGAAKRASLPREDRPIDEPAQRNGGKGPSSSNEIRQITMSEDAPQQGVQATTEKKRGYHENLAWDAMEKRLRHLLHHPGDFANADLNGLFCIVEDVTKFHPFEEVTEFGGFVPRYYLHWIDSAAGKKKRSTKQEFGWKQSYKSGRRIQGTNLVITYFNYELRRNRASKNYHSDAHSIYRQDNEDRLTGKVEKGTNKRWRLHQVVLSDDLVKELLRGKQTGKTPAISIIFQDKSGTPVYPTKVKETQGMIVLPNENNAPATAGSIAEATFHIKERRMSSSHSSNTSPLGERLPPGGETLQEANSIESEESVDLLFLHNTGAEGIANESNAPVPMEAFREAIVHNEERRMTSSISSSTSPPGEGLPSGGEPVQGDNSNENEESDDFAIFKDALMNPQAMEVIPDKSFFPEQVREAAMIGNSWLNALPAEGLLSTSLDDSFFESLFCTRAMSGVAAE